MNPEKSPELTVQALMKLRQENDAVRLITERLGAKEMGPADHIRTKHEVKAFVEAGDTAMADSLVQRAEERRAASQVLAVKVSQQRSERIGP
jgi:hypothetical protein